ncbi:heat shock factor binding protein 1-domain-containing protein [Gautieria morchelliformis]|nr:heat shock factor binding protein 1-domain-containing protein [Gautieria morchelliformis]
MPTEPFKALKVPSNGMPTAPAPSSMSVGGSSDSAKPMPRPEDISSPHELTAFVETLLGQLETKFDDMSSQILDRMSQMSARVDSLETSIQDLINGDVSVPQSPAAGSSGVGRKSSTSGV